MPVFGDILLRCQDVNIKFVPLTPIKDVAQQSQKVAYYIDAALVTNNHKVYKLHPIHQAALKKLAFTPLATLLAYADQGIPQIKQFVGLRLHHGKLVCNYTLNSFIITQLKPMIVEQSLALETQQALPKNCYVIGDQILKHHYCPGDRCHVLCSQ